MGIIIGITVAIDIFVLIWTWKNLEEIEKTKKITITVLGFLIMHIITLFLFNISKNGVTYQSVEIEKNVRNVLVALFASVNSLILPFIARLIQKLKEGEIEKQYFRNVILIIIVIFFIFGCFESTYMKDTQKGILKVYQVQELRDKQDK